MTTLEDIGQRLGEQALKQQVQKAEIESVLATENDSGRSMLRVSYEKVTGDVVDDALPVPQGHYDFRQSDLVTLIEFTKSSPNEPEELIGSRVPFKQEAVRYDTMRTVLSFERSASTEWTPQKLMDKAINKLEGENV